MKRYHADPNEYEQYEFDIPPIEGHASIITEGIDRDHYTERSCPKCGRLLVYIPDDIKGTILVPCRKCKVIAVLRAEPTRRKIGFASDF